MTNIELLRLMQRRLAQTTIGAQALRNQGLPGMVDVCRSYFEHEVDLTRFFRALPVEATYQRFLDHHTQ